jgi:Fe-S cluster assembly ATP-binding protein
VDALAAVSRRVQDATRESGLGVLAITHFSRLLEVLEADTVHVLYGGRIRLTGGPELSERLEAEGYVGVLGETPEPAPAPSGAGFGDGPFTDPLG